MERKSSPWRTALAAVVLLAALSVIYVEAFLWRLPLSTFALRVGPQPRLYVAFPSKVETVFFWPAVWVHIKIQDCSLQPVVQPPWKSP